MLRMLLAGAAVAATLPCAAAAQVRASERGTVSQVIDGATLTLDYSRPVARGRTLFGSGGVVAWGRLWTPGANWATTLETDRDLHVNGQTVPKGRYSIWMIPNSEKWTVILSRQDRVFHTQPPADSSAQARFEVIPQQGSHMETLAWYFPVVAPDAATLRFHWGTTIVALHITTDPTRPRVLSAGERAQFIGSYELGAEPQGLPDPVTLEVFESTGRLRARARPALFGNDAEFDLVWVGNGRFAPGWYQSGKFFDVETDMVFVFGMAEGRATSLEFRGVAENLLFARGRRVK